MTPAAPSSPTSSSPALPAGSVARLAWVTLAAVICAGALAGGVMAQVTFDKGAPDLLKAGLLGTFSVLVASAAGFGLFALAATRTPAAAALALLAGSTLRMIAALAVALLAYFLGRMDSSTGVAFWMVFLACGMAAIVAETAWGVRNLNRPASHSTAPAPVDGSSTPSHFASAHGTH